MQYGHIDGVEKPISRIVQGTAGIIGMEKLDESFKLLDDVYSLGISTFDTAHGYGRGDAERALGSWIEDRGLRDKVVVITKGAHPYGDRPRVTPFDIEADIHDSMARLRTDHFEIYLLHRDDPSRPVGPIVEKLNEYHEKGVIGVYGGSNWHIERIQQANAYAAEHGLQPFTVSSPNFSLAVQTQEPWPGCVSISAPQAADERDWYVQQKMPLFTWSSLAGGFFSGRFRRDNLDSFTEYFDKIVVNSYISEENFARLDRAEALAAEKGVTLAQIAVAYVFSQALNIFGLFGNRRKTDAEQNIAAQELKLSEAEVAWLNLESDSR